MSNFKQEGSSLKEPPKKFFMSLRDIFFWLRSAKADETLAKLQQSHNLKEAFDLLYKQISDPYGASASYYRYQQLKYDTLLSLLPAKHYSSVLDLGCGLGEFTRKISEYADSVLGVDLSKNAVEQARILSVKYNNVYFEQADVLELNQTVGTTFHLIILADVLYYLSLSDDVLKAVCSAVEERLEPDGILLLVNQFFFGYDKSSQITRQIHDSFRWSKSLKLLGEYHRPFYLISLLQKLPSEDNHARLSSQ